MVNISFSGTCPTTTIEHLVHTRCEAQPNDGGGSSGITIPKRFAKGNKFFRWWKGLQLLQGCWLLVLILTNIKWSSVSKKSACAGPNGLPCYRAG